MAYKCISEKYNTNHIWSVVVHATCQSCSHLSVLLIPEREWLSWNSGELIQKAMPTVSEDSRELLISGLCAPCFYITCGTCYDDDDYDDVAF